ncbi:hypothetical protein FGRMN_1469 [Fusarium graminum]|nr:hypothetical protein FGRMN_1469 [Fusarium graminum]
MSAPSETASRYGSEIDAEVFGSLAAISEDALIALATRNGSKVLHVPTDNAKLVKRIDGSYNIVHAIQLDSMKLVIRVPATGWAIRLVRQKTEAPVPEVYDWDPTNNNEISATFICMAFLPGDPTSRVWFDQSNGPEAREELRLNILFDEIGSVTEGEDGSFFLGPVFNWDKQDGGSIQIEANRTYFSTMEYLACNMRVNNLEKSLYSRSASRVLELLIRNPPDLDSHSRFALRPPDFDSQNILVDDKGNVTGIIDWDLCQTMLPHQGYARYPGWITRDWDPLMYGWPRLREYEDSPDTLRHCRDYYSRELGEFEAMDVIGDIDDDLYSKEDMNELEPRLRLLVCPPDTLPQLP